MLHSKCLINNINTMKKFIFLLSLLMCYSCTEDLDVDDILQSSSMYINKDDVSINRLKSDSWELWNKIKIAGVRDSVSVPWNLSATQTSIPDFIRLDIKSENGWKLLANTIENQEKGMNYLIFYNQFTGVLKGFYYLTDNLTGNNGIWNISLIGGNHKLFYNEEGYFSLPLSEERNINTISVTNMTSNPTKGFTLGWNCFQTNELSFDPNQPVLTLYIDAYTNNISKINLKGNFDSESSGTILSNNNGTSPNKFLNGTLSIVGDYAKQWLFENTGSSADKDKPLKENGNLLEKIKNHNIGALYDLTSNFVFGSFLGMKLGGSQTTDYKLHFKTSGNIQMEGNSNSQSTTKIYPLRLRINDSIKLGVWNLKESPKIQINNPATLQNVNTNNSSYKTYLVYNITRSLQNPRNLLLINDLIKPYLRDVKIEVFATIGSIEDENYNSYSTTRSKLTEYNSLKKDFTASYKPGKRTVYKKYHENSNSYSEVEQLPNFYTYPALPSYDLPIFKDIDTDKPVVDIWDYFSQNKLLLSTEDVKVQVTFLYEVNGHAKEVKSIRTYDPSYFMKNTSKYYYYGNWTWNKINEYISRF